jgi:hypothetical protein
MQSSVQFTFLLCLVGSETYGHFSSMAAIFTCSQQIVSAKKFSRLFGVTRFGARRNALEAVAMTAAVGLLLKILACGLP